MLNHNNAFILPALSCWTLSTKRFVWEAASPAKNVGNFKNFFEPYILLLLVIFMDLLNFLMNHSYLHMHCKKKNHFCINHQPSKAQQSTAIQLIFFCPHLIFSPYLFKGNNECIDQRSSVYTGKAQHPLRPHLL